MIISFFAGQQQSGEQELATKMLQIQSKRFYIDVKQNRRGRFMKVAEIGADGRRNQVFLALSTAAEFRDHLSHFSDFYANLGPPNPDTLPEDGKLKSETMVKDNRRYYLDLKENSRGRFLRVSQTIARGGPRCQIAIPAQAPPTTLRRELCPWRSAWAEAEEVFRGERAAPRRLSRLTRDAWEVPAAPSLRRAGVETRGAAPLRSTGLSVFREQFRNQF
ncbi:putative transcriptional activator protein Pur-alpha isoform X2 [Penaeus vannamei]|uniref:Putative transcriptional activator protein Pur-alpha isoform X2 n=1 Tax=Penaeus vannamei TaxID=6689 RepID=A0A423SA90_PENVA|nr:putative transcriptional activator protein Pur-alpha isoform X2 [Penaeus vannamei]